MRKACEAHVLSALRMCSDACGGNKFDVLDVTATPGDIKSVVTIQTGGAIDQARLKTLLLKALMGQE